MWHSVIKEDIEDVVRQTHKEIFILEGKNILITGASGMLASYLVYALIYANETLFKKKARLFLVIRKKEEKFGNQKYLHYIHQDITNMKLKKRTSFHYIIHAASKAAPKLYSLNMIDTINTNIVGLYNIFSLVDAGTKSILFFSSGETYGKLNTQNLIKEDYIGLVDHLNPRSCYVEGKRACESICMNYFLEKKYPIKIVRIFHTFGPGLNLDDGRIFSDFIKKGLQNRHIEINGNPNVVRSFLYLKDAAIMFLKILTSNKNGEVYNIASEKNIYTIAEIAQIVSSIFNKRFDKNIKVKIIKKNIKYYLHAPMKVAADISKFKKDFGYTPDTAIEVAFGRTIQSLL